MPHPNGRLLRPCPRKRGPVWRSLVELSLAGLFAMLFHHRYWKWCECIEAAASSCVTDAGENLTSGGAFWAVPALVFAVAAVLHWRRI